MIKVLINERYCKRSIGILCKDYVYSGNNIYERVCHTLLNYSIDKYQRSKLQKTIPLIFQLSIAREFHVQEDIKSLIVEGSNKGFLKRRFCNKIVPVSATLAVSEVNE